MRERVLAATAAATLVLSSCATVHRSSPPTTTPPSSTSTTLLVHSVVAWNGGPLVAPIEADDGALVVTPGSGPVGVSRDQAVALAVHVLGDLASSRTTIQTLTGEVSLSAAKVQIGSRVPTLIRQPAWVVAYRSQILSNCPMMTGTPPVPANASDLDALLITGPTIAQVTIYHGTGTGPCVPSTHPVAVSAPNL